MNKTLQGITTLAAMGSVAFSTAYALTGNSHNVNQVPPSGIYSNNTEESKNPGSVRIQETPTPEPTQAPTPEPTPEPTPIPTPAPTAGNSGGGGNGNPSVPPTYIVPTGPRPSRIR